MTNAQKIAKTGTSSFQSQISLACKSRPVFFLINVTKAFKKFIPIKGNAVRKTANHQNI